MKFNDVISVGHSCNCKKMINDYNLSTNSYPTDRLEILDIKDHIRCISNNFEGIFDDVTILEENSRPDKYKIIDNTYNIISIHDVKKIHNTALVDVVKTKEYIDFKEKMKRRSNRWNTSIYKDSICFIRMESFVPSLSIHINTLFELLKSKNNNIKFHYLRSNNFTDVSKELLSEITYVQIPHNIQWNDYTTTPQIIDYISKYHT